MTAPTPGTAVNTATFTATTSPAVTMPATVDAGDLLVVQFGSYNGVASTAPSGWTRVTGGNNSIAYYYKIADGTEDGTSVNFVQSSSSGYAAKSVAISGAHASQAPELQSTADVTNTASPNSPSITASWGAEDNLVIAGVAWGHLFGTNRSYSSPPSGYTEMGTYAHAENGTAQTATEMAYLQLTATATEDPGAHTLSGSAQHTFSTTLIIRPAAAAPTLRLLAATGAGT